MIELQPNRTMDHGTRSVGSGPETLASEIIKSVDTFLKSFRSTMSASVGDLSSTLLLSFLTAADRLNHNCSQRLAWVLLEHSAQPDVRAASEGNLLRLVRSRCFEPMDIILENYVAFLAQLHVDLRSTVNSLTDSRLRNALLGIELPSIEAVKKFKLPKAAREAALFKMLEYVKHVESLPDVLLDYGLRKLAGHDGDPDQQERLARLLHSALDDPFRNALSILENHAVIKRKRWEEDYMSENAVISAVATAASCRVDKRKSGVGSLLLAALFAAPAWYLWSFASTNLYLGAAAGICALAAFGCGLWAIFKSC